MNLHSITSNIVDTVSLAKSIRRSVTYNFGGRTEMVGELSFKHIDNWGARLNGRSACLNFWMGNQKASGFMRNILRPWKAGECIDPKNCYYAPNRRTHL